MWRLTKKQACKLEGVYLRFLRKIVAGVNFISSYEEVIIAAVQYNCVIIPIECYIIKRDPTLMGHIERHNPKEIHIQLIIIILSQKSLNLEEYEK